MLRIQSLRTISRQQFVYSPILIRSFQVSPTVRQYSIKEKVKKTLNDLNDSTKGASKIIEKTENLAHKVQDKAEDLKDSIKHNSKDVESKAKQTGNELKAKGEEAKRDVANKAHEIKKNNL
ncbi:hypothetical protein ACO0SA_002959 [Hanseniaspora valbyensis]